MEEGDDEEDEETIPNNFSIIFLFNLMDLARDLISLTSSTERVRIIPDRRCGRLPLEVTAVDTEGTVVLVSFALSEKERMSFMGWTDASSEFISRLVELGDAVQESSLPDGLPKDLSWRGFVIGRSLDILWDWNMVNILRCESNSVGVWEQQFNEEKKIWLK
jgi:hypothetical protein